MKAIDGGISWFDTAEVYGRGESERSRHASRPEQAAEAAGAMELELGREELDRLDRLS